MTEIAKDNEEKKKNFALYLLFKEAAIFDKELIKGHIESVAGDRVEITPIVGMDGVDKKLYGHITIGDEAFDLLGVDAPLPENIMKYTIGCAYGNENEIQEMKAHGFHILAFYKGENKDKQAIFNAYKKLAYGFLAQGLLGVANPYSWNVISAGLLQDMVEDESAKSFSETPAMMIWRNFIKLPLENGMWFVTKGNNLFGIHEYAYFGNMEEAENIYDIFETVFSYIYEGEGTVVSGDTMQIGKDEFIRFKSMDEITSDLKVALRGETIGTLVIEKISRDEINE